MKNLSLVLLGILIAINVNAQCGYKHRAVKSRTLVSILYNINQSAQNLTVEMGTGIGSNMFGISFGYHNRPHSSEYKPMVFMQTMLFGNNNLYGGIMIGADLLEYGEGYVDFNTLIGGKLSAFLLPKLAITYNIDYALNNNLITNSIGITYLF